MGLIRKAMSVSTIGGVKFTSRREAETKEHLANAKLARAQRRDAAGQPGQPSQWDEILASFEAGETVWDDLTRFQKMSMPIGYQLKCKAAQRKHATKSTP
jgi:hypothetical protein